MNGPRDYGAAERLRGHILGPEVFRAALVRERKRSDRTGEPFGLLLVEAACGPDTSAARLWGPALDAVRAIKRYIDVAGWLDGRRLGVIMPQIRAADLPEARERFHVLLEQELAAQLGVETAGRFSVRLQVYPEPHSGRAQESWPVDTILYPDLRRRRAGEAVYTAAKRALDVAGSLSLLATLSPLLLLIAALVRCSSPGAILFRQTRVGYMAKPFTMLKFRTMYSNADPSPHREFVSSFIKASCAGHPSGRNGYFKLTDDPRITPVGRLLRSTSLDELPQLWNVLRGDMSLVGPRPPLAYELEQYEPWHRRRVLEARPGITGLWQVTGRSRTTFDEMVRLDLRYARQRSFWRDVRILLATPAAVLSRRGAC
jgi:lipopolysaccharide/colanic/teichoic acid biosynthesis glycosyltransferase